MGYLQDFECPSCKEEIELEVFRWNTEDKCPKCGVQLIVDFDFVVLEDGDEWDLYDLKIKENG